MIKIKKMTCLTLIARSILPMIAVAFLAGCSEMRPETQIEQPIADPAEDYFPLGVYWPWETTRIVPKPRAENIEAFLVEHLDDLAAHNVTVIWTVNGPGDPGEVGLLCRLAKKRGIHILLGSGGFGINGRNQKNKSWLGGHFRTGVKLWRDLEEGSRPDALVIADEPRQGGAAVNWTDMDKFAAYAARFATSGIPVTTTVEWGQIQNVHTAAKTLPFVSLNIYPFFGSPHGWRGAGSYGAYSRFVCEAVAAGEASGIDPWVMGQAYQEVWGPARMEEDGTVTVLKGAGQHWLMPTPAQIRWQIWTAMAHGAKGMTLFCYAFPKLPKPETKPNKNNEAWAVKVDTPSGGPIALKSFPDYLPGPQYKAMGETYGQIRRLRYLFDALQAYQDSEQLVRTGARKALPGDLLAVRRHTQSGELYLMVIASPENSGPMKLLLNPNVVSLEPMESAPTPLMLDPAPPFTFVSLAMKPGAGAFYRLVLKEPRLHKRTVLFQEDFSGNDFTTKAMKAVHVRAEGKAGKPRVIRAKLPEMNVRDGNPFPHTACYLLYDLETLAPWGEKDDNSIRLLEHTGWGGSPAAGQGVFIWAGPALNQLKPLVSSAQPRHIVQLEKRHRFLKIGISYRQATPAYAGLSSWSVVRWENSSLNK